MVKLGEHHALTLGESDRQVAFLLRLDVPRRLALAALVRRGHASRGDPTMAGETHTDGSPVATPRAGHRSPGTVRSSCRRRGTDGGSHIGTAAASAAGGDLGIFLVLPQSGHRDELPRLARVVHVAGQCRQDTVSGCRSVTVNASAPNVV